MAEGHNRGNESLRIVQVPLSNTASPWVDVIALHGLHSTFTKTWCNGENDDILSPWLTGLPFTARIFAYDNLMSFSSENSILDRSGLEASATTLLAAIFNEIKPSRPLVFLCHNIAGIVVKELLWIASHDTRYLDIALATTAVVFFGVPDMLSSWEDDLLRLALETTDRSVNERPGIPGSRWGEMTEAINKGPSALQAATMRFEMIKNRYHIISVRELPPGCDDGVEIRNVSKDGLHFDMLMPSTNNQLPPMQPENAAFQNILSSTQKPRKYYQYDVLACIQRLALHYQYDDELGKIRTKATSDVPSPLCRDLISREPGLITIYGSAGSGKSVLASQISAAASGVVLSFSFSVADYRRSSYRDLLISFLLQLLYRHDSVFDSAYVQSVYTGMTWVPSVSVADLYRLLSALLSALPKTTVTCVIDALDECEEESRIQIVGDFKRIALGRSVKCMVFLTCRLSDDMMAILGPFDAHNSVNLNENMKHVRSKLLAKDFADEKLRDMRRRLDEENATPLKVSLIAALDRIEEFSYTPEDYGSIYKLMLAQIDAPPTWLETLLLCIAFSQRPLTVAELAAAVGVDRCLSEAGGAGLTLQKIQFATPRQFRDDLELLASPLIHIQNGVVQLVHGTLREFIRQDLHIFAKSRPPTDIHQTGIRSLEALRRSLAILSITEIREVNDIRKNRPFDYLCGVPVSSQPYSFARYAGFSLVQDLELTNKNAKSGELRKDATEAFSKFWDNIEARSWWIQAFTDLQGEAALACDSPLETSLYLAASMGIQSSVERTITEGSDSLSIQVALRAAISRGNLETTRLLLATASKLGRDIWSSAIELSYTYGRVNLLKSVLLWRYGSAGWKLSRDELDTCLGEVAMHGSWHIIPALLEACPQLMDSIDPGKVVLLIETAAREGRDGVISELFPIFDRVAGSTHPDICGNQLESKVDPVNVSDQNKGDTRTENVSHSAAMDTTMQEAEDEAVCETFEFSKGNHWLWLSHAMVNAVQFGNPAVVHLLR
ncbi:hypothetical protein F4802DRAFT_476525 [Xylaria palmicola]|nr:hypothetical protein F4802DRAFT_476525 [Xylaria palmicola]